MTRPMRVGLIGCGNISPAYLEAASSFDVMNIVACADIDGAAARKRADEYGVPALSVDRLLADPEIDVVLNLTIPKAHGAVNRQALEAGKHAYCEKPLGIDPIEALEIAQLAQERGLRIGCAPDTFLGGGHQTCRKLIDEGAIGKVVSGTACMMGSGHESWHPSPAFYYEVGGGPLFDMGPYYITALVNMLGPVTRVAAITTRGRDERTISSKPLAGTRIAVEVDTHVSGVLEFSGGAVVTLIMSFDVWFHNNRPVQLHGTDGSLSVPDPNRFGGKVRIARAGEREWTEAPSSHGYNENFRSLGLADMCQAIIQDRPTRCSGDLAYHVLEVMAAFQHSSESGQHIAIESQPDRPQALPTGLDNGQLD
jgi:predicted dehydrogenase